MQNTTLFCFWISYLIAWLLELIRTRRDAGAVRWAGWGMTAAGLLAHTIYLGVRANRAELTPLIGSPHDWLLVLAWIPVPVLVVAGLWTRTGVGAYLLAPVLVIVSAAPFVSDQPSVDGPGRWLSVVHAGMLALGTAGIVAATGLSVMYLVQHRRLKTKTLLSAGSRMPSLERVAKLNWWAVAVSVPLLTTGLALGVVLVVGSWRTENPVPLSEPPFVGVAVLWLLGLPLLVGLLRTKSGRGKSVAWRTVLASGFLLGSLLLGTLLTSEGSLHGANPDPTTPNDAPSPTDGDLTSNVEVAP